MLIRAGSDFFFESDTRFAGWEPVRGTGTDWHEQNKIATSGRTARVQREILVCWWLGLWKDVFMFLAQ